jgi:uncharacterized protein YbaP (TraB family)
MPISASCIERRRIAARSRIGRGAILALVLGALIAGCASERAPIAPAQPQLITADFAMPPYYRVEGEGGANLLLFGTVHLGPASGWQFSPALLAGLDLADGFVLEIDLRRATEDAVSDLLASIVVLQPPDTLPSVVSPETKRLLDEKDAQLAMLGMPVNARLRLKPWFIAMGLIEVAAQRSGFSANAAAENVIMEHLGERPLLGLETFEEQIAMLDGMSAENQDIMLRDTLLRLDDAVDEIQELVEAWRHGDEEALESLARVGVDELPELEAFYDILLDDRNRRWMERFRSLLDDSSHSGETIFVGVGALHLVGEGGLVALLREEGYPVDRIDHFGQLEGGRR